MISPSTKLFLLFIFIFIISTPFFNQPHNLNSNTNNKNPTRKQTHHPLDPLSFQELSAIQPLIVSNLPPSSLISSISLLEPHKTLVLLDDHRRRLPRLALAVAYSPNQTHTLTIDVDRTQLINRSVNPQLSGYPTLTSLDVSNSISIAINDPEFAGAFTARNLRTTDLSCIPLASGWYGDDENKNFRLIKIQCFSSSPNIYMHPVEGPTAFVDLDAGRVVRVLDSKAARKIPVRPVTDDTDYRYSTQKNKRKSYGRPVNPVTIEQANGPSFIVDGHLVKWAGWEFHLKADARAGMVVSRARVVDPETGEMREVMYKGMVSELFVPYMDPSEGWYFKTYLDAGEYGFGRWTTAMVRMNDCPRGAYYMDGVFHGVDGRPFVREDVVCLFEKYDGGVAWRHAEDLDGGGKVNYCYYY